MNDSDQFFLNRVLVLQRRGGRMNTSLHPAGLCDEENEQEVFRRCGPFFNRVGQLVLCPL